MACRSGRSLFPADVEYFSLCPAVNDIETALFIVDEAPDDVACRVILVKSKFSDPVDAYRPDLVFLQPVQDLIVVVEDPESMRPCPAMFGHFVVVVGVLAFKAAEFLVGTTVDGGSTLEALAFF